MVIALASFTFSGLLLGKQTQLSAGFLIVFYGLSTCAFATQFKSMQRRHQIAQPWLHSLPLKSNAINGWDIAYCTVLYITTAIALSLAVTWLHISNTPWLALFYAALLLPIQHASYRFLPRHGGLVNIVITVAWIFLMLNLAYPS